MPEVIDNDFKVCSDCFTVIGTGDYTSFDYYYSDQESAERIANIDASIGAIQADTGYIYPGDSEHDESFGIFRCPCCGDDDAGARHHCVILSK